MSNFPFKETTKTNVLFCQHLLEGANLKEVYHLDVPEFSWRFICDCPEHTETDIIETTLGEIYKLYPEIAELADMPLRAF